MKYFHHNQTDHPEKSIDHNTQTTFIRERSVHPPRHNFYISSGFISGTLTGQHTTHQKRIWDFLICSHKTDESANHKSSLTSWRPSPTRLHWPARSLSLLVELVFSLGSANNATHIEYLDASELFADMEAIFLIENSLRSLRVCMFVQKWFFSRWMVYTGDFVKVWIRSIFLMCSFYVFDSLIWRCFIFYLISEKNHQKDPK